MDDKTLITLVEKFGAGDLAELELDDGSTHLVLRKAQAVQALAQAPLTGEVQASDSGHAPVRLGLHGHAESAPQGSATPAATSQKGDTEAITSPIVATFYRAPSPDAPAFAEIGQKIKAGETLCILEAMKMMNHLEAEFDCEIVAVKAQSGELVEYGQSLFEVKRL